MEQDIALEAYVHAVQPTVPLIDVSVQPENNNENVTRVEDDRKKWLM